jgi:hypothetical protein
MLILSFIFFLCNAESFTLERKQFDSLQCLSGDGCHLVDQIQSFECQGDTNHSLACKTNLHDIWRLKNVLIQCNEAMDHCTAEFTLKNENPHLFFLLIQLFVEFVTFFFRFNMIYPWHSQTTPNAVLSILKEECNFFQKMCQFLVLMISFFIVVLAFYYDKEMRSRGVAVEPSRPAQPQPLDLPKNVKLTYFFATEAVEREMIHDKEMLNKVIHYCAEEFGRSKDAMMAKLICERSFYCDEPRLSYRITFTLPENIGIGEHHMRLLRELYPKEIQSINTSPVSGKVLVLVIELISSRAITEIKSE